MPRPAANDDPAAAVRRTLKLAVACWADLATVLAALDRGESLAAGDPSSAARQIAETLCFLALEAAHPKPTLAEALSAFHARYGEELAAFPCQPSVAPTAETCWQHLVAGAWGRPPHGPASEILGLVHQRLLDQRLAIDTAGQARVETCRRGRKAGGVFYTPPAITAYMAQSTLAKQQPWTQPPLILDPACGAGQFLVAAARHLLASPHDTSVATDLLSIARQLHGVDVDPEAVLVARRSVWLELMAQEDGHAVGRQLAAELTRRIVCADVLAEAGPFGDAAFDVVLGNPPYHRELGHRGPLAALSQTRLGRQAAAPRMDLWYYFLHRGLELLRPGGRLSFVVAAYWTSSRGAARLHALLRDAAHIDEILLFEAGRLFPRVAGRHMILTVGNCHSDEPTLIRRFPGGEAGPGRPLPSMVETVAALPVIRKTPEQLFRGLYVDLEPPDDACLQKLGRWPTLGHLGAVRQGIVENPAAVTAKHIERFGAHWRLGEGVFALSAAELTGLRLPPEELSVLRPYHDLADLGRYRAAAAASRTLIYATPATWPELEQFPALAAHLSRFRPILEARRETRSGLRAWWHLHWPRQEDLWQRPKLVALQMAPRPAVAAVLGPVYVPFSTNVFVPHQQTPEHLYYLAALLNSRLLWIWFRHHAKCRGVGLEINGHVLAAAPIRRIDFTLPADVERHDELVRLMEWILQRPPPAPGAGQESELADAEDRIDQIVCDLYGVDDGEAADAASSRTSPHPNPLPGGEGDL